MARSGLTCIQVVGGEDRVMRIEFELVRGEFSAGPYTYRREGIEGGRVNEAKTAETLSETAGQVRTHAYPKDRGIRRIGCALASGVRFAERGGGGVKRTGRALTRLHKVGAARSVRRGATRGRDT